MGGAGRAVAPVFPSLRESSGVTPPKDGARTTTTLAAARIRSATSVGLVQALVQPFELK